MKTNFKKNSVINVGLTDGFVTKVFLIFFFFFFYESFLTGINFSMPFYCNLFFLFVNFLFFLSCNHSCYIWISLSLFRLIGILHVIYIYMQMYMLHMYNIQTYIYTYNYIYVYTILWYIYNTYIILYIYIYNIYIYVDKVKETKLTIF